MLKVLFLLCVWPLSAHAEVDPSIEKILIANNFTSQGHMQNDPGADCSLQVIPPPGTPDENNPYWVKARSVHLWLTAFPAGKWELDLRQSILRRSLGGESWYMAYHFDPITFKFNRFYEMKSNTSSSACILGE